MRKLLNTLYITTPDAYLAKDGDNILIKANGEIKFRIPINNLENIVCFGYEGASPSAMYMCCERGVGLTFLNEHGKFLARVSGKVSGNVLLRKKQYKWSESPEETLRLSKRFIQSKIHNSRRALQRSLRDHRGKLPEEKIGYIVEKLKHSLERVDLCESTNSLRGIEGEAANYYFSCFDDMIISQKEDFSFDERVRRPPTDAVNAMLSFLYSLLTYECSSALETVGLDPQVGYLHSDRPGRQSLSLDLMEEFRAYYVDRLVLSLINKRQVNRSSFLTMENGAVIMKEATRKVILVALQERKREEITHPFLNEKIPIGLLPYVQAMLLARNIRGDMEDYVPFLWK